MRKDRLLRSVMSSATRRPLRFLCGDLTQYSNVYQDETYQNIPTRKVHPMGNPKPETTQPAESNHHGAASLALLSLTDQVITFEQQQGLIAAAGVRAQLAVAYELNTIGRILAYNGDIVGKVDANPAEPGRSTQHNAIVERLGL